MIISRVYHSVQELEKRRSYIVSDFYDRYGLLPGKRSAKWNALVEWALASPEEILVGVSESTETPNIVSRLENLPTIRKLDLTGSAITSADVKKLANLSKVEQLMLSGTRIDDSASQSLATLTKLRTLDVSKTSISDAALPQIAEIKSLRWINLLQTNVSAKGLEELQSVRPDLEVTWNEGNELTALMPVTVTHSMHGLGSAAG